MCVVACADDAARNTTTIGNIMSEMDAATAPDAALDAPVAPRDARVSAPGLGCPAMWAECAGGSEPWRVIAEAQQFGRDARFTALSGDLVLVQGGGVPWRVVRIGPDLTPGEPSELHSYSFPSGDWEARGLARTRDGVAVVACGERCALLSATLTGSALRAGVELPLGYQVAGLAAADDELCVFGSEVSCLVGGRWQSALAPGEDVIALALATARSVALTRSGRVFATSAGGWVEEAPASDVTSVAVAGRNTFFSSADSWLERSGADHRCEVPDGVAAVLVAFGGSPQVLSGRGDLLTVQGEGFCRSQRVQVGEVIAASSGACSGEPRVISATQLIGDNRCDLQ